MRRWIALAAALVVAALFGLAELRQQASVAALERPRAGPSVSVQLAALHKGSLPRIITAYGTVGTSPAARQTIQAPVAAVVHNIYVKSGDVVAKGAPLIRLGPSPATAAAYTQALTALRAAHEEVRRARTLLDQHLATRQQLIMAEKTAADARAALAALRAEGAGSPQTLRAPFQAVVTAISTNPGAIVAQGAALTDLAQPSRLVLHAGVVPGEAVQIRPGDTAQIVPLGENRGAAGRVVSRGSVVDPKTGLVAVDLGLPAGRFFAGEMAQADIVIGEAAGYVVPHQAILVDDQGAPYVVQAVAGRARVVKVHVVLSDGARDVVTGPLDPKASLVLAGNYQLKNGMKIRGETPKGAKHT
jgi:membrane fusion protein, multidrug efflux system